MLVGGQNVETASILKNKKYYGKEISFCRKFGFVAVHKHSNKIVKLNYWWDLERDEGGTGKEKYESKYQDPPHKKVESKTT